MKILTTPKQMAKGVLDMGDDKQMTIDRILTALRNYGNLVRIDENLVTRFVRELVLNVSRADDQAVFIVHETFNIASEFTNDWIDYLSRRGFAMPLRTLAKPELSPPPILGFWRYAVDFGILLEPHIDIDLEAQIMSLISDKWLRITSDDCQIVPAIGILVNDNDSQQMILPSLDQLLAPKVYPGCVSGYEIVVGDSAVISWLAECRDGLLKAVISGDYLQPSLF